MPARSPCVCMSCNTRLDKTFRDALVLPLDYRARYILFSDCHRGTGKANDNFLKNEFLYIAALKHYEQRGFTYLELGDGDELWENRSMKKIKEMHRHSFEAIARLYAQNRFYGVYGNHDMVKKKPEFARKHCCTYYCDNALCDCDLCPDICFYPGIILKDSYGEHDIYLTHGHQADLWNSTLWRTSRFLVRYIWRNLEFLGIPDPTSAAENNVRKGKSEKRLIRWAKENDRILISGHTHRPMAGDRNSPYFNTGSCVHPAGITGIEIERRCVTLVKWSMGTKNDLTVYVKREVLGETVCLDDMTI